jgi:hypothetical protein
MQTRLKLKYNERGQLTESLTTAVFGLVFVSKVTYEYNEDSLLTAEIHWQDTKQIKSIKRFTPAAAGV